MGVLKVTEHLSFRQACLAGGGGCAGMQLLDAAELERRAQVPPDGGRAALILTSGGPFVLSCAGTPC